jgi:hypothetical protein
MADRAGGPTGADAAGMGAEHVGRPSALTRYLEHVHLAAVAAEERARALEVARERDDGLLDALQRHVRVSTAVSHFNAPSPSPVVTPHSPPVVPAPPPPIRAAVSAAAAAHTPLHTPASPPSLKDTLSARMAAARPARGSAGSAQSWQGASAAAAAGGGVPSPTMGSSSGMPASSLGTGTIMERFARLRAASGSVTTPTARAPGDRTSPSSFTLSPGRGGSGALDAGDGGGSPRSTASGASFSAPRGIAAVSPVVGRASPRAAAPASAAAAVASGHGAGISARASGGGSAVSPRGMPAAAASATAASAPAPHFSRLDERPPPGSPRAQGRDVSECAAEGGRREGGRGGGGVYSRSHQPPAARCPRLPAASSCHASGTLGVCTHHGSSPLRRGITQQHQEGVGGRGRPPLPPPGQVRASTSSVTLRQYAQPAAASNPRLRPLAPTARAPAACRRVASMHRCWIRSSPPSNSHPVPLAATTACAATAQVPAAYRRDASRLSPRRQHAPLLDLLQPAGTSPPKTAVRRR